MTLLTLMPCRDQEVISKNSKTNSSFEKTSKGAEHFEQDECPPFCTCACCSVSRYFLVEKVQAGITQAIAISYLDYLTPAVLNHPIEIYQPPKLA